MGSACANPAYNCPSTAKLISVAESYDNFAAYGYPEYLNSQRTIDSGEYNSNSFIRSVLEVAGVYGVLPGQDFPGWYEPVPACHFTVTLTACDDNELQY